MDFKKYVAEFIGTMTLVTLGCGTAMLVGCDAANGGGYILTAFAFGLTIIAMAYSIGNISGCHINPAVSLGVLISGGMTVTDFVGYIVAQCLGAFTGSGLLSLIFDLGGVKDMTKGYGSNGLAGVHGNPVAGLLVAVFSAVAYTLLNRGISGQYTPFERTYFMLGFGAFVFTVMAAFSVHGNIALYLRPFEEQSYLAAILFLSVCCSVIAYFLSSYVITGLPVARATVFANLTTAVSVFAGTVFLHEPFSALGLLFCILILIGIYGVQRGAASGGAGK